MPLWHAGHARGGVEGAESRPLARTAGVAGLLINTLNPQAPHWATKIVALGMFDFLGWVTPHPNLRVRG